MGYGTLSEATWISPYDLTKEVEDLVKRLQVKDYVQIFQAKNQGFTDPKNIVSIAWDLSRIHQKYAKDWKRRTGGKVLGYFCTYAPEEVLYAANVLPVRILGGHEPPTLATPHMFDMWCPFSRDYLNQGLQGKYDYLDGIMAVNACLHPRQAFGAWIIHVPTPWNYWFVMPNAVRSPRAKTFLRGELDEFKKAIEKWTGKIITDKDLDRDIDIMNTNRRLMKQVYEFRKQDNPPITGTEAMTMVWASQLMDKREHNESLKQLVEALPAYSQAS